MKVFQQVLAVFIAWLNLDLGIELVFFHGMDAYIITVVKLVGSSAVSILATLFLFSYAKLQRTVITAFSFTYFYENGRPLAIWLYDGNISFLRGKHTLLFLMALAVTLLFILPFTLLLLFCPLHTSLQQLPSTMVEDETQPPTRAYQGPYKDNFRF